MAKQVNDTKIELAITKLYIKDLESLIKKCEKPVSKEIERRKQKLDKLKCEYETYEDAQTGYGFGEITQTEFERLQDFFISKETQEEEKSVKELYLKFLKQTLNRECRNLNYLEEELKEVK
ncbi:hypothetical protein J2Z76_000479 [Sedimentibacter acidaminivorans]|uniref:Uncharacterized protein n=1 Tax=Sedimentibacter acidaminivorans TaxID=913099 RepID=A0ABS4GAA4_9FIRM|nr:hypothetical protein [Sedimentibacter acidaminivorans]MBP1924626.1 hypothetical protein [Sedimentibacter acidaminivorans]